MNLSPNAVKLLLSMYKNYSEKNSKEFVDSDFELLGISEEDFYAAANELHSAKLIFNESNSNEKYLYFLFEGVEEAEKFLKK